MLRRRKAQAPRRSKPTATRPPVRRSRASLRPNPQRHGSRPACSGRGGSIPFRPTPAWRCATCRPALAPSPAGVLLVCDRKANAAAAACGPRQARRSQAQASPGGLLAKRSERLRPVKVLPSNALLKGFLSHMRQHPDAGGNGDRPQLKPAAGSADALDICPGLRRDIGASAPRHHGQPGNPFSFARVLPKRRSASALRRNAARGTRISGGVGVCWKSAMTSAMNSSRGW